MLFSCVGLHRHVGCDPAVAEAPVLAFLADGMPA